MKKAYLILTRTEIEDYLKKQKRIEGKDYELIAALILIRFHRKQTGENVDVALSIKENSTGVKSISEVIEKHINEDTPIDFILVPAGLVSVQREKIKGAGFQLKRIVSRGGDFNSEEVIEYLTRQIPKHYGGTNATLVLLIEKVGRMDLKSINQAIATVPNYPFKNVMYLTSEGDTEIIVGELFPRNGYSRYKRKDWFYDE